MLTDRLNSSNQTTEESRANRQLHSIYASLYHVERGGPHQRHQKARHVLVSVSRQKISVFSIRCHKGRKGAVEGIREPINTEVVISRHDAGGSVQ